MAEHPPLPPRPDADRLARELDWNLLRTFVVLAEAGSVTEAAERLRLKQPTVSAALKRLEDRLGRRLIDRSPGRYRLTEAGKLLHTEAVEIQGAVLRLGTAMREVTDEVRGHVRIALASHVVCPLLDDALGAFHAAHPRATLSLDVASSRIGRESVLSRRASLAVCLVKDRSPALEYRRLYREFFALFCGPPHPLFGKAGVTRADLAGQASVTFITDQMDDALRPVALMRAAADLDQRIVGSSSHLEEVRRMIVAGIGIGPLPVHVARRDVEDGRLWRVPSDDDPAAVDVHVCWNPKARKNRAEAAFLALLLARIEATPMAARTYA
jgi:DNA-binding transcriptional LysR family regulator